jgi:Rad52/22 family double-strand break repair protein
MYASQIGGSPPIQSQITTSEPPERQSPTHVAAMQTRKTSAPPVASFGSVQYTEEERLFLQRTLEEKLDDRYLSSRQGPGGQQLTYIETWRAIELANHTFGTLFSFDWFSCAEHAFAPKFA